MKNLCLLLLCIVGFNALAQKEQSAIESLKAPSMPSSSIIGVQANEVNRPKSLKSVETALLNNFQDDQNFVLPNSFAIELNPFMLGGRKNFDYNSYLENKVGKNMWRNFSISLSSTTNYFINDSTTANAMGVGFRTIILNGHANPEIERSFKRAKNNNQEAVNIKGYVPMLINANLTEDFDIKSLTKTVLEQLKSLVKTNESEAYKAAVEALVSIPNKVPKDSVAYYFVENYKKYYSTEVLSNFTALVKDVKMNRYGWRMELDMAYALSFPDNNFNYSVAPRWGAWTNVSYKPLVKKKKANGDFMKNNNGDILMEPSDFEFIGLARWMQNNQDFFQKFNPEDSAYKAGNFIDIGGRIVWEKKKIAVELEAIYRIKNTTSNLEIVNNNSYKYLINLNYNITQNVVISYYLGKDFDQVYTGNLISGLSLNLGFGDIKLKDVTNSLN